MGITYDKLKQIKGNSVVLEKQEKIEIEQTASNFTRRKHTVIREKFPIQESKGESKTVSKKSGVKEPFNETICRALLSSLISEREQTTKIKEKLDVTAQHLNHLKEKVQHDIKDLKQEQSSIKMSLKPDERKREIYKNIVVKKHDKTWSEKLRDNATIKRQESGVMVERYSQKHQCVCTSPRYTSNVEVAVRPKMRTIALQIGTPKCCPDKGAVGDHRSLNALNLKEEKVKGNTLQSTKELLLKPMDPSLSKDVPQDYIVNCCYGTTCCAASKPCHALCQRYSVARECNGVICNQKTYQETGVTPQSEYNYCRDELYYVYPNSPQMNTPQTHCVVRPQCRCMDTGTTTNKIYGRPCSDLNTEYFYCRKIDRSASPKTQSTSKSKGEANAKKINEAVLKAKQAKEKKEGKVKECSCEETCEEYALRKKRECEEKQKRRKERSKSRERSKSKDRKKRSKSKDLEEEKLRKRACEEILNESASKLVEFFDRYADGKDTSIGALFRYLADAKTQLSDESSSTATSCNTRSEGKTCPIPIKKKCTCPKHSPNFGLESADSLDDNRSRKSQYSLEALQMLKKMKLREYKPAQPSHKEGAKSRKSKTKTEETKKDDDEKSKRYKEYINKYRQEDGEDNDEQAQNSKKLSQSTEQPQSSKYQERPSKKRQNVATDDEDVMERYEYGPAVENGYRRKKYDDDTQISQNQPYNTSINYDHRENLRNEDEKSKHTSARTRRSVDESGRESDYDGSKYNSPRPRLGDTYESNGDERYYDKDNKSYRDERDRVLDNGPKDERLARTQVERKNDQTPGSPRYFDHYNTEGVYRSDEYPLKSQNDQEDIKHSFSPNERGNRYENPSPSRRSYETNENRNQTKQSSKYQDEPPVKLQKPAQSERGNRYQTPSPSRGSYETYENRNQTKQSSQYQDKPSVNLQKPAQSQYDNYPIKHEEHSQNAGHETQRSQRSSFEQQRQDEMTAESQQDNSRFNQQITDHQLESQSDGMRRNDAISKTEVTDQESFRTYTKSTEIPKAEQRVEEPRDKGLIEGFSGPISQHGYTKYKQNIKTKYTQEQDGTEVTHTDEEITIDETYGDRTNSVPTNTEEAIRYLKSFLDSYERYGFEEDCLKSVSTITNELINKLSTCTPLLKSQSASSSPRLENYNIVPENTPLIEETKSTETQFKDLESTSYAGPIEIKQDIQTKEEVQNYSPTIRTPTQNATHSFKEMGQNSYGSNGTEPKENSSEQTTIRNTVEPQVRAQDSFSNNASSKDSDNYRYETVENYHYCEKQTQSQFWETEENYETLSDIIHLNPPDEFIDPQYVSENKTNQYPQQSSNCEPNQYINTIYSPPPMINTSNNNDYYCVTECPESKYNNTALPCSSRASHKCCCNTSNRGTTSRSLEEAACETELLPLKGILKPCRVKDVTAASTDCDFETNRTTSSVSFGNKEQIKSHKATSRMYTLDEEKISQVNDENIDTIITKDESQRPLRKQSTITRCETTVKQPLCKQIDSQQSSCASTDAHPIHCQSAQEAQDETIPRFTHCPCMLDTYLKLLEIYCKEEDKFDFIKN